MGGGGRGGGGLSLSLCEPCLSISPACPGWKAGFACRCSHQISWVTDAADLALHASIDAVRLINSRYVQFAEANAGKPECTLARGHVQACAQNFAELQVQRAGISAAAPAYLSIRMAL